jgi:alpha-N-arabinofuranosidase
VSLHATVDVDINRTLGAIDPRVYGTLAEHIGRVIYGGLFDPESSFADADGMRTDVLAALRDFAPTVLRWPGGNFASGYHWRDGVGPTEQRAGRHDLAWDVFDPNTFGTEEFLNVCRKIGAEPYIALNAGTGTVDEATGWVEYCNGSHPVPEVLLRRTGPHPEPHKVKLWGLGNENYGWWQHMHTDADSFAELTREWGKLLYWTDSSIEIVGVGAAPNPEWNATLLTKAGRSMDFLSLHYYWHAMDSDPYHSVLAGPMASERDISIAWEQCLEAARELKLKRPVRLAIDEWGVWNGSQDGIRDALSDMSAPMRYGLTPKIGVQNAFEEWFDVKDALAVASWFHVLWRHPEKIGIATYAQVLNTIAPLMVTEAGVVRQTIFHPLVIARHNSFQTALDVNVGTDSGVPAPIAGFGAAGGGAGTLEGGEIPAIDVAGTTDGQQIHLSFVNRSLDSEVVVGLDGVKGNARRIVLHSDDPYIKNTPELPDAVLPIEDKLTVDGSLVLPPHSHTTLVFGS